MGFRSVQVEMRWKTSPDSAVGEAGLEFRQRRSSQGGKGSATTTELAACNSTTPPEEPLQQRDPTHSIVTVVVGCWCSRVWGTRVTEPDDVIFGCNAAIGALRCIESQNNGVCMLENLLVVARTPTTITTRPTHHGRLELHVQPLLPVGVTEY